MDTTRSAAKAAAYLADKPGLRRETRTYRERLTASPEAIFPLLCPTRELDWIPGWDCELLHTDSGYAEEGLVFKTQEGPDQVGGEERVWYCDTYEPPSQIAYLNFLPNLLTRLVVSLDVAVDAGTDVTFCFAFLALNDAGNATISAMPSGEANPHHQLTRLIGAYLGT